MQTAITSLDQYQEQSREFALYPQMGRNFVYPALGLAGETGEVCDKIKKVIRDKGGVVDDATLESICLELGEVPDAVAQF